MSLVLKDRVRETTTTTGTGALALDGTLQGFQSFSVIGDGNQTYYVAENPAVGEWEVGLGTYSVAGNTLSRDEVYDSSNGGALVDFAAGEKRVFVSYPAPRAVVGSEGLVINSATINTSFGIPDGSNAVSAGPVTVEGSAVVTIPDGSRWVIV